MSAYATTKSEDNKEQLNAPKKKDDHFMDNLKYACIKIRNDIGSDHVSVQEEKVLYNDMGY